MSRAKVLVVGLLLVFAVTLGACGDGGKNAPTPSVATWDDASWDDATWR